MHSVTQKDRSLVVGGVDSHADTHHFAALDQRGALLATKSFQTTTPGYAQALDWLHSFGEIDTVAVESTGCCAAALVRYLREHDIRVVEVNQRRLDDSIGPLWRDLRLRLLRVARSSAVKSRTAATVQIRDLIITAPQELRDQLADRKTLRGKATVCSHFRSSASDLSHPTHAAKFALRSLAQRIATLDHEIESLDQQLEQLVAAAALRTVQLLGISTGHAGQLLVTAGQNIERLKGEASFAALCGASPIPASSGKPPAIASTPAATAKPTVRCT